MQTARDAHPTKRYLSASEFRLRVNRSDSTLRVWRKKGLPYVGGVGIQPMYIDPDSFDWLRRQGEEAS